MSELLLGQSRQLSPPHCKAGLGTAAPKSYSGEFLLPTPETIEAAAARSARERRPMSA